MLSGLKIAFSKIILDTKAFKNVFDPSFVYLVKHWIKTVRRIRLHDAIRERRVQFLVEIPPYSYIGLKSSSYAFKFKIDENENEAWKSKMMIFLLDSFTCS